MEKYYPILLQYFGPIIIKFSLYLGAFRFRKIQIQIQSIILVACAPFLLLLLPVPGPILAKTVIAAIGVAYYYTDMDLYPDLIAIVVIVEIVFMIVDEFALSPLIQLLK